MSIIRGVVHLIMDNKQLVHECEMRLSILEAQIKWLHVDKVPWIDNWLSKVLDNIT